MTREEFSEQYAYRDVDEYTSILGIKVSESHRIIWDMARMKNKHLGFLEPETKEEPETELP